MKTQVSPSFVDTACTMGVRAPYLNLVLLEAAGWGDDDVVNQAFHLPS